MGRKLDQYFDQLTVKLRLKAGEHLEELERRTSRGEVPLRTVRKRVDGAWVDVPRSAEERHHDMLALENTLRVHLGAPQLERRILVEVEPGTTWESALADFERATHPAPSVVPFEIVQEVKDLSPIIVPGIYEITTWSDPAGEGDRSMGDVLDHFAQHQAEAWLVPVLQWFAAAKGPVYYGAMVPSGGNSPLIPEGKILVFGNYQRIRLALEPYPERGAGTGSYIGAKFVQ